ncbi:hypothetical protein [Thermococcus sp.]
MRRIIALMMVLSFLLVPLGTVHTQVAAATELPWAFVDGIKLTLGDTVTFGNYKIVVKDIDSISWSKAILEVSGPQGTQELTVSENTYVYYPNPDNPVLRFSVILWNSGGTPTILLTIASPLIKTSTKVMTKGGTVVINPGNVKVTLLKVNNTSAEFEATTPTSTIPVKFTLNHGQGRGINYRLTTGEYTYTNFVYMYLNTSTSSTATVEIYMPKVPVTSLTITPAGGGENPTPSPTPTPSTCNCLMYNGILYSGEKLLAKYENVTYGIQIVSVSSTKVSVKVYKGSNLVNTYLLSIGQTQTIPGTSMSFMITSADVNYNRVHLKLYAPKDTQVTPPVREASIKVTMNAIPKKILLSDYLVVAISVENNGRGDAYDLNVAAPIPNGFELVSSTQSWNIKTLPAFSKMPALIYVLKPTKVGTFEIGKAVVKYYDDKSLLTGTQRTVYSATLKGIVVYAIPNLAVNAQAYNGTWSNYVTAKPGDTVKLKFAVKADGKNPTYEFVTNATLHLYLGNSLDGSNEIKLGTIKAGESKDVMIDVKVLKENLTNVRAVLTYLDPLGNEHSVDLGNLLTINSIPPKVVIKEVKVWPTPEELPGYVNKTLAEMGNNTTLATQIDEIAKAYLPPQTNTWKPIAILFIILTIILGAMTYKYWDSAEKCRKVLEKKKAKRPGGLPKKEEEGTGTKPAAKREGGL